VSSGGGRKREEAREEYRKALFEGRTAALLEQERADTFSQKLGSLPPGETADVEIEVLQPGNRRSACGLSKAKAFPATPAGISCRREMSRSKRGPPLRARQIR
jgi:hypothetical protein